MALSQTDSVPRFLPRAALAELVALLRSRGYTVIGPKLTGLTVMLGPVESAEELAHGIRDEQDGGTYRLVPGSPDLGFEYVVGMNSARGFLFPPTQRLYQCHVEGQAFILDAGPPQAPKLAFLGIRPCDLAAMHTQDRVFGLQDSTTMRCTAEDLYAEARKEALLIVVNCTKPAKTCFCTSMGTGPAATAGFDLCLTELRAGFVITAGSDAGRELLKQLPVRDPTSAELELAELKLHNAADHMGRRLDTKGLKEILDQAIENPQWDDVAKRCLSCGNCTMVCPTCFCSTVMDSNDIENGRATRSRLWESCHTHQFTYTTAGPVRNTTRGRYRHWLRHKLCTWFDQFGVSGCVGCGRCITWCPVGIDITAEAARIRQTSEQAAQEVRS
ncbi:MAG: 4Fe-4S dicluster domain-containing protein [Tepidisphaeraceae bacterium]